MVDREHARVDITVGVVELDVVVDQAAYLLLGADDEVVETVCDCGGDVGGLFVGWPRKTAAAPVTPKGELGFGGAVRSFPDGDGVVVVQPHPELEGGSGRLRVRGWQWYSIDTNATSGFCSDVKV